MKETWGRDGEEKEGRKEGKEMKGKRMKERGKMRIETKAAAYIRCDGVI